MFISFRRKDKAAISLRILDAQVWLCYIVRDLDKRSSAVYQHPKGGCEMTKLAQVRAALEGNPGITVVAAREGRSMADWCGSGWAHTVDFVLAPAAEGVYTAEGLQSIMMSLVPGLETTSTDNFWENPGVLKYGRLYFDESVGGAALTIVITAEDVPVPDGILNDQGAIERTLACKRRVWVRLYPDAELAEAALRGRDEYEIHKADLLAHRRAQLHRVPA